MDAEDKKPIVNYESELDEFPDDGELYLSKQKSSEALIFFCHFFQGHKKALKRHIEFVNQIGFDAYAFSLNDSPKNHFYVPYSERSHKFGMKHALSDQIEDHLEFLIDKFPMRKIVVFAFSNVVGCAIEAMARHFKNDDWKNVVGLIADSGPGAQFLYSSYKLLEQQMKVTSFPLKILGTPFVAYGWSPSLNKDISHDLKTFPIGFPVLSIRGWKDQLISPKHIDKIFESAPNIQWQKLSLTEAKHLTGLRDFPQDYQPPVESFLAQLK